MNQCCLIFLTLFFSFSLCDFFEYNILVGTNGSQGGLQGLQGISVSMSSDGNILAVGGSGDNFSIGATWVFMRNGNNWTQQGDKLVGSGYEVNATFKLAYQGAAVSVSGDGNTLAVGGTGDNGGIGATWIFVRNGSNWTQQGDKLVGSGYNGTSHQGQSVSLSSDGNTLAVGGPINGNLTGAAWIFVRNGSNWTQQGDKLVGSGYNGTSNQGRSVSLSGDGNTLAVGGFSDNKSTGATWIFVRNGTDWTQQGDKLVGSEGNNLTLQGRSVSLSGDGNTLAIGGNGDNSIIGATWIFVRKNNNWTQQGNKLVGSRYIANVSWSGTYQGWSVSLSGDGNTLAVGGYGDNALIGATWIFVRNGTNWTQQGDKLVGSKGSFQQGQGTSVSLNGNGDTLAVGGPNNNVNKGATWIFLAALRTDSPTTTPTHSPTNTPTYSPTSPTSVPTISPTIAPTTTPSNTPTTTPTNIPTISPTNSPTNYPTNTPTSQSPFFENNILVGTNGDGAGLKQGTSVSFNSDGNILAVGGDQDAWGIGATWIFVRNGNNWTQQGDKLVGSGYNGTSKQGFSVSLSGDGNTLAVGGPFDANFTGATWVFVRNGNNWSQQGDKLVGSGYNGTSRQGHSVSLSSDGNTLAVGGHFDNVRVGATWIFVRNGNNWTQQGDKLVGSGHTVLPQQGFSVGLSSDGNTLAIGGFGNGVSDNGGIGATWIFVRKENNWTQQGDKLVGSGYNGTSSTNQGQSVSLSSDGNTLAVGGHCDNNRVGAIWIFVRNENNWTQQGNKLVGSGYIANETTFQGFSVSLSSDGNTLAVGGPGYNNSNGATWIFMRNGINWIQQGDKLVGSRSVGPFTSQGTSVCLNGNGDTLAIGGPSNGNNGTTWIFLATPSIPTTPTHSPTNTPTNIPTNIPTLSPTNIPTNIPTTSPTNIPTLSPTNTPTNIPTLSPTNIPTITPTNTPTQSPIQTCPSNYTLIGKECIPCIGDWIPQPISGSVHLFCSDCKNGRIILARKVINSPNCPDTNADNVKCEPCNFPCQLDDITQIDVDKNKTQVINQIKNLLEAQDYFDGLVGVVSDNETDSDVTIRDNSLFFGFYPCLETTNMTNYKVLVKSLMDDIFKTKMVVTNVTSYHYPICQVELNFEKKESTDFKMILIYSSSISVPVLIVIIVILIIYQRYLSSKLHKLPDEISWSFLLKLRRPFRWSYTGTEDNGYYYCYFTKGSDEWNRVTRYFLRNHLDSKMRLLDIESIIAVYNPTLTSSFINKWFGFMKRIESSAFRQVWSFMDKTSSKETKEIERINTTNSLKDKTYKEYLKLVSKFEWNHNDCQVPIISVLHATDYSKASFISLTGFACLSSIDSGYYGKGIYFTSSFFYSIPYLLKNSDPAIIISYVLPGNVYPVIEKPFGDNKQKNNNSFLGKTLKNGFDSHYVITAIDGYPATTTNLSANVNNIVYDELVIVQEHQIVPAFILRFSHPTIKPFFMKYKQDLYSYQRTTSQVEEEEEFHLHEKGGEKIFQNEREKEIFNYDASTNFKDNINEEDESEFLIKLEDDNFGSYNSRFKQVNKNNTFNMSSKGTVSEELMTLVSIGEEI